MNETEVKSISRWQTRAAFFMLALLAVMVLLVLWNGESSAETLYVDDDAGEGGDGSLERPFKTIQEAIDSANNGDSIIVQNGNYSAVTVNKTLRIRGNGTKTTWIGWISVYGNGTIIENFSSRAPIVIHESVHSITIRNFSIESAQFGILCAGENERIVIIDCFVTNWSGYNDVMGVSAQGLSDSKIINSTFQNCVYGISIERENSNVIDRCVFSKNTIGVYLVHSRKIEILYSTFEQNSYGIYDYRSSDIHQRENIFKENKENVTEEEGIDTYENVYALIVVCFSILLVVSTVIIVQRQRKSNKRDKYKEN